MRGLEEAVVRGVRGACLLPGEASVSIPGAQAHRPTERPCCGHLRPGSPVRTPMNTQGASEFHGAVVSYSPLPEADPDGALPSSVLRAAIVAALLVTVMAGCGEPPPSRRRRHRRTHRSGSDPGRARLCSSDERVRRRHRVHPRALRHAPRLLPSTTDVSMCDDGDLLQRHRALRPARGLRAGLAHDLQRRRRLHDRPLQRDRRALRSLAARSRRRRRRRLLLRGRQRLRRSRPHP